MTFVATRRNQRENMMMHPSIWQRFGVILGSVSLTALVWVGRPNSAVGEDEPASPAFCDALSLSPNSKMQRSLAAARDLIAEENWDEAVRVLQGMLDQANDQFVLVRQDDDGKTTLAWESLQRELDRIMAKLGPKGQEVYELHQGTKARDALTGAIKAGSLTGIAEVARRYFHTKAGLEASILLGTYYLEREHNLAAAECLDRLATHALLKEAPPLALAKAALAHQRLGDSEGAERWWQRLRKASPEGIELARPARRLGLDDLQRELTRASTPRPVEAASDWLAFRGNAPRNAVGLGGTPFLDDLSRIQVPTIRHGQARRWLEVALAAQEINPRGPALPGAFPLAVGGRVIVRSHDGVFAFDMHQGRELWRIPTVGGLDTLASDWELLHAFTPQLQLYLGAAAPYFLLENTLLGAMSSDTANVYLVDDLALPLVDLQAKFGFAFGVRPHLGQLEPFAHHNRLLAVDVRSGKLKWRLGGRASAIDDGDPLLDAFFLGAPLPVGDRLYTLIESRGEMKLACLEAHSGRLDWTLPLAVPKVRLGNDPGRRLQAIQPTFTDGLLLCPTHSGVLFAVEPLTRKLVWSHVYVPPAPPPPAGRRPVAGLRAPVLPNLETSLRGRWRACTAVSAGNGLVVFTAPDSDFLHCVRLRDGSPLWTIPRSDDLYLADVSNDRVLLVGSNSCRAVDLKSGNQLWKTPTGRPAGMGVASRGAYYLPLTGTPSQSTEAAILALDLTTGKVLSRYQTQNSNGLGNLIFHDDLAIVQSFTSLAVYPQLERKKVQVQERLARHPTDPEALFDRATLRLADGDGRGALDDLRTARNAQPNAQLQFQIDRRLFDVYRDLFERDFGKAELLLSEFESVCRVTAPDGASAIEKATAILETRRRLARYYHVVDRGREAQGKLVEALRACLEFVQLADERELIPHPLDPSLSVRPEIWTNGRVTEFYARATPKQREELDAAIAALWKRAPELSQTETNRLLTACGDRAPASGEVRLERATKCDDPAQSLAVTRDLLALTRETTPLGARAAEALYQLLLRHGQIVDAAGWLDVLGDRFAHVALEPGRTGADVKQRELSNPKIQEALAPARPELGNRKLKVEETAINAAMGVQQLVRFVMLGDAPPSFRNHVLAFDGTTVSLKWINLSTGVEVWSKALGWSGYLYGLNAYSGIDHHCHAAGRVVVVNLGPTAVGIDPVDGQILWRRDLAGTNLPAPRQTVPRGKGVFFGFFDNGQSAPLSRTGPIDAQRVCLATREGLMALDPVSGQVLWERRDVTAAHEILGDAETILVADLQPGAKTRSLVLRGRDGVRIETPDFSSAIRATVETLGHKLVVQETKDEVLTIRLFDPLQRKDDWKAEYPAGSRIARSLVPGKYAVVRVAKGSEAIVLLDLTTGKETTFPLAAKDVEGNLAEPLLLADRDRHYLAISSILLPGGAAHVYPNVLGLRTHTVNGTLHALDLSSGKEAWRVELTKQQLVLDQFEAMPVLVATARIAERMPNNNVFGQQYATKILDKRTGATLYEKSAKFAGGFPQFFSLAIQPESGTVVFRSGLQQLEITAEPAEKKP
jgi:outer membrane protein assembly factor BamB